MNKEVEVINYQIFLSIIIIITVITSIILNYNTALDLIGKRPLFSKKLTFKISKYRNLAVLIISILFLYLNYISKNIAKEKNEDSKVHDLQILASYLTIIASYIIYYVVIANPDNETVSDIENPII